MRRRCEAGATLVEAAFAIPIFFMLVLGLVDFGIVGLNDNQAGNAARDGARVGAINYLQADIAGSGDRQAIVDAIEKNLPGRSVSDGLTIQVDCIEPDDSALPSCADAEVDRDRIRVRVRWDQPFLSPIAAALGFGTATVDGESAVVIIGAPVAGGGVSPTPCDVTAASVIPDPVTRENSGPGAGELQSDLTVQLTGTGSCGNLTVRLVQGAAVDETVCVGPSCVGVPLTLARDATDQWTAGSAAVDVSGDDTLSDHFTVVDPALPVCAVTGVTVTPDPVQRETSGANAGTLKSNLAINVVGSGTCPDIEVELEAPNGSTATVCSSGSCVFGINGYSALANNFWTEGSAVATVSAGGIPVASTSFQVIDGPACVVSVAVSPDPAKVDSSKGSNAGSLKEINTAGNKRKLDVVVDAPSPCLQLTVTLTSPNGSSLTLCSGTSCVGTLKYTGNETFWSIEAGNTTASATVTGDGTATTTFEIEE